MHVIMPKRRDKADVVIHSSVQRPPIKIDVVVIQFIKGNDNYNYKDTTTHPRHYKTHSTRADVYQQNEPLEEKTIAYRLVAFIACIHSSRRMVSEPARSLYLGDISRLLHRHGFTERRCWTNRYTLINYLVNYYVIRGPVLCFDPVCSDLTCSSQVRYK